MSQFSIFAHQNNLDLENISLTYPSYFIFFCLLAGAGYAYLLYGKNPDFKDHPRRNLLLAVLRGLAVALITFLLLNPVVKRIEEYLKPPIVLIGVDQSLSVGQEYEDQDQLLNSMLTLEQALSEKYDVRVQSIGGSLSDTLSLGFDKNATKLSDLFSFAEDQFSQLNLQHIILASDGIFNKGKDPRYALPQLAVPVHTIRLGDTSAPKDINIKNIFHNEVAFLNDRFEVEVDIEARFMDGTSSQVTLERWKNNGTEKVATESVRWSKEEDFKTLSFILDAKETGAQRYTVKVSGSREDNTRNNSRDFFVEVLDSRKRILIVREVPHPDITALKAMIAGQDNLECEVVNIDEASGKLAKADLVILHEIPNANRPALELTKALNDLKIPRLFILGPASNLVALNKIQTVLEVAARTAAINEVQARFDRGFDLFRIEEESYTFEGAPPLYAPFGEFTLRGGSVALADQAIGKIDTDYPLVAFAERAGLRTGVIAGSGLWRWRIMDYSKNKSFERFDNLLTSIFQYLSLKEDRTQFRVRAEKNIFDEQEHVFFSAEVYDNAFEPTVQPEVTLELSSSKGDKYNYTFTRGDRSYQLDAGVLAPGNYSYAAQTTYGGKVWTKNGKFTVKAIELELYNTMADHGLLRSLSSQTGGTSVTLENADQLTRAILANPAKAAIEYQTRTKALIHWKFILWVVAFLLALEWFLRRYFGRY
jgi:hypothetical protein